MSVSTAGLEIEKGSQRMRAAVELLSSMRFAIALLTVICIASVIGTVVKQHEAFNSYVNQFGPFWAEVFAAVNLYSVYSAWWFLLILAFLVLSTTLCIVRNTPKILLDLRQYKENIRTQSLKAFAHRAEAQWQEDAEGAARRIGHTLVATGWKVKLQRRETPEGVGWMVAAKVGAANKIGYLAAHAAIVLICIGGLFDGDLIVRAQTWFNGKTPFTGTGMFADVPEQHRLSDSNPTFRGNLLVTEGGRSGTAMLVQSDGLLLQDLPFEVELKKFVVEYYSTGMPKLFASDIVIHDRYNGASQTARVEVNHPVSYRGVEIYQSSFDDGGSLLKLKGVPLDRSVLPLDVQGRVGTSTLLTRGQEQMTLEFTGLRVINVENFAQSKAPNVEASSPSVGQAIESRLGSAHKTSTQKELRNVGPSVTYKLRDAAGQAREYHNYMLPLDMDGQRVFVLGVRDSPAEAFRYLRVPVDEQDSMDSFVRLRVALSDPAQRLAAAQRYARFAGGAQSPELVSALAGSAQRVLDVFAGEKQAVQGLALNGVRVPGGLPAVWAFIKTNVPEAERERADEVLLRILNGSLFELYQMSREKAGLPPAPRDDGHAKFMTQAVLSLSDAVFYPSPMVFMLSDFEQVQASVFQVARAPGKTIVYLGCLFLIVGVFAMLYVRERRLWVWLAPAQGQNVHATLALSTNRKMLDTDREFTQLQHRLLQPSSEVI